MCNHCHRDCDISSSISCPSLRGLAFVVRDMVKSQRPFERYADNFSNSNNDRASTSVTTLELHRHLQWRYENIPSNSLRSNAPLHPPNSDNSTKSPATTATTPRTPPAPPPQHPTKPTTYPSQPPSPSHPYISPSSPKRPHQRPLSIPTQKVPPPLKKVGVGQTPHSTPRSAASSLGRSLSAASNAAYDIRLPLRAREFQCELPHPLAGK